MLRFQPDWSCLFDKILATAGHAKGQTFLKGPTDIVLKGRRRTRCHPFKNTPHMLLGSVGIHLAGPGVTGTLLIDSRLLIWYLFIIESSLKSTNWCQTICIDRRAGSTSAAPVNCHLIILLGCLAADTFTFSGRLAAGTLNKINVVGSCITLKLIFLEIKAFFKWFYK